ncbi:MAG: O-antigen translocase, partial [Prochlorococcaceae cyanobacterium]
MKHPSSPRAGNLTAAQTPPLADTGGTFRGILKSSALIGGSSLINIGVGAMRTKALALLLGPAGIGLMGGFTMILELSRNIAQLGLPQSGVRQIAEAASSGDKRRLALTRLVLQRTTFLCAVFGALTLWAFSAEVSTLTFGTKEHATSISLLSVALFLSVVSGGQSALLNGMRRMMAIAKVNVYGSVLGAIATISIVYFTAERGIVPSLVAISIASFVFSLWYSQKERTVNVVLNAGDAAREAALLFRLGLAFLASSLLMSGAAFTVRTFVLRTMGLDAAGMYQAAWALGGLYVGFVLQALGQDFYPRLVGVVHDHDACNATVNEQSTASLLLAAPGIIATITFARLVIYVFYSAKFDGAIVLLQWMCLGMALRVITWPPGFIIVAKNRQFAFIAAEASWATFNIAATWLCLHAFGLEGAGIAFLMTNIFHAFIIYYQARCMTGFRWSSENMRAGSYFV